MNPFDHESEFRLCDYDDETIHETLTKIENGVRHSILNDDISVLLEWEEVLLSAIEDYEWKDEHHDRWFNYVSLVQEALWAINTFRESWEIDEDS